MDQHRIHIPCLAKPQRLPCADDQKLDFKPEVVGDCRQQDLGEAGIGE